MKNKILSMCILVLFTFVVSSCNMQKTLNRELEKMEKIINDGELFNDDFSISLNVTSTMDDQSISNFMIIRDSQNYYFESLLDENKIIAWIIEKDDKYLIYLEENNNKFFITIHENNFELVLKEIFEYAKITNFDTNLMQMYRYVYKNLLDLIDTCNSETTLSCNIEKVWFNKVKFNVSNQISDKMKSNIEYIIKKGRILSIKNEIYFNEEISSSELSFDYSNQKLSLPDFNEYNIKK